MMRHHVIRLLAVGAIGYAVACGGLDSVSEPSCSFSLVVTPDQPVRGDMVEVAADVYTEGGLSGVEVIEWSIRFDGADVAFEVTGANGDEVVFPAGQAGVYNISATGSVGGTSCDGAARDLNVTEPGAVREPMRLVIVPRTSSILPPQSIDFELPGGADYTLSSLTLQTGDLAGAVVRAPDSEPLAGAYLRATLTGAGPEMWVERFSQEDGEVNLRMLTGTHDLLVVPDADLPALLLANVLPADLNGSIVVDDGISVTGTVEDGTGDPMAGARVQLTVAGAPSTIGTTNAGGAFTLAARAGGPVAVIVTPTEASGLPALEVEGGPSVADGATLDIRYSAALDLRTVSPVLRQTDGTTPAAGARVTFIARPITGAGTIGIDGSSLDATGQLTRAAQANGSGVIPDQRLTNAVYDIVVEPGPSAPSGQGVRFAPLDLRTGQGAPPSLLLAAPGRLTGQVVDADGAPVEGAKVAAAPGGLLSRSTAAGDGDTTGADGTFALALAGGGSYQIRIDGPAAAGRVHRVDAAPAAGDTSDLSAIELPRTLRLTGALTVAGGSTVAGALIQLRCLDCGPGGAPAPVAEAVSSASGEFVLLAPDPGVAE